LVDLDQNDGFLNKNAAQKLIQIKANSAYKPFETTCF